VKVDRCAFVIALAIDRRRKRSPSQRGHHDGGTQGAVCILFAGAESVPVVPRLNRPRNRLAG